MSSDTPEVARAPRGPDEAWDDHLAPLRAIGRVLFGTGFRALSASIVFALIGMLPVIAIDSCVIEDQVLLAWPPPPAVNLFLDATNETLAVAVLLGIGCGMLRAIETVAQYVQPEASYARKLAMGVLVALGACAAVYGLLVQVHYVGGLLGGGSFRAGLGGVQGGGFFGRRSESDLAGLALAFGLTGFGRARGLPLWEQVALISPFGLLWISRTLVYEGTWVANGGSPSHWYELTLWLTAWTSALLVPVLARWFDRLEEKWTPRRLRARGTA